MLPLLAETVPTLRAARLAWFAAALAATTLAFALSRPVSPPHVHHHHRGMHASLGHCVEMTPMPSAEVRAFYVHY
jgi:hypothetical protein